MNRLVLFDIDGTLVLTGGAGGRAVSRAFTDLFAIDRLESVAMAGRTDRWIFTEIAARNGIAVEPATLERVRAAYLSHLVREIERPSAEKRVLPGVAALLDVLVAHDEVCLGLLTGNMGDGARLKLDHFGLWDYFAGGGFGDAAVDRVDLFAEAIAAIADATGVVFTPAQTVIVGDTTHDVAVARASGARCVAVASGSVAPDALAAAGADVVLPDLSDLSCVLAALGVALPSL